MRQKSIFTTLFLTFSIIILLSVGISGFYSITAFDNFIYKIEKDRLIEKTEILASLFPKEKIYDTEYLNHFTSSGINGNTRITVIDINGAVLSDTIKNFDVMDNHLEREEIQSNLQGVSRIVLRHSDTLNRMMMYYSVPIDSRHGVIGFLRTSMSMDLLERRVDIVTISISIISLVFILLSVVICYIVALNFSITINSIKRVADHYAKGEFNNTLPEVGSKEMVSLSRSINCMGQFLKERISTIIKQKNRYKSMLESMHEPVLRFNNNLIIEEMNRSAEILFNRRGKEIVGEDISFLTENIDFLNFVKKGITDSKSTVEIIKFYDEKEFHHQVNSSILYDADNTKIGLLLVMNDLTERIRLEDMRKEFVANVSHELRTPTTAIQGYIETLTNNNVNEEQSEKFLKIIYRHSKRLNSIIDDLLMLTGLENLESSFVFETFSVSDLISSVINVVAKKAEKSQINIIVSSSDNHLIYAHPLLAEQALTNLITNSITYSNSGSTICITTRIINSGLQFEVVDEGCGIPEEDQEQIFERFYRVDRARSREQGGTGLGLSIVKRVMNIHKGQATLQSEINIGSVFRLFFPVE